jgi:phosphoribosylglycinamide formyltransferase-1
VDHPTPPLRVVVLVSGSGTLLQALLDDVAQDGPSVAGLARGERAGIPTFVVDPTTYADRPAWDAALADAVGGFAPGLVVSAGFMRILGARMLADHRVINTHPALLPSFPGAHGVRDALAHGVKVTGTTCHWVDDGVDTGPIIEQRAVRVADADTEDSLHERIKVAERAMLVEVVRELASHGSGKFPRH